MPEFRSRLTLIFLALALAGFPLAAEGEILKLNATASYYGKEFDGKTTASGEVFDMRALTAAHKTLPFGTLLEVTNLANGKRVTVRVNDRGPFVANREIDLSYAAAEALGMLGTGIAKVSIRKMGIADGNLASATATRETPPAAGTGASGNAETPPPENPAKGATWRIQLGSFSVEENAERFASSLRAAGFNPTYERAGGYIRVILGGIADRDLELTKARLADRGYKDWLAKREAQ